ncbi:hypothetical protein D3C87_1526160 [compost metagenome]
MGAVVTTDGQPRHPTTIWNLRSRHEARHDGALGGLGLKLAQGVEQPLPFAVQEVVDGGVVIGRQGQHLDVARRDRDPSFRSRGGAT